ncbi:MAG TPA: DinB family protein [Thermomicrobiales bacterium]|nr:DinB family protein [Thermomicrobiales bacterium]
MLADAIRNSYRYDEWATTKIFDAAGSLTPEQLDAQGPIPHGTIRQTLLHLLIVHKRFLSWWDGSLPSQEAYRLMADPADYPDLASVRAFRDQIAEQTRAFVDGLSDKDAVRDLSTTGPDGSEFGFPCWQMMQHVANHNTQHRSEVAVMLTEFDCSPGDIDLIFYQMAFVARA